MAGIAAEVMRLTSYSAPIGLNLETIAKELIAGEKPAGADVAQIVPASLDIVETNIRAHLGPGESELDVAQWLKRLADAMEGHAYTEAADNLRGRVRTLVSHELNQMDGFDR